MGLRAKGNNSRRLTEKYGLDRYSLKVEFDHYEYGSYYGLDKFSLDSSFQDNSYMKTWITYDMMDYMGVHTPLCSYAWVRVNGGGLGAVSGGGRAGGSLCQEEFRGKLRPAL